MLVVLHREHIISLSIEDRRSDRGIAGNCFDSDDGPVECPGGSEALEQRRDCLSLLKNSERHRKTESFATCGHTVVGMLTILCPILSLLSCRLHAFIAGSHWWIKLDIRVSLWIPGETQ